MFRAPAFASLVVSVVFMTASAQRSASLNLESLVQQSGMIFAGKVVGIETGEKDPNMNLFMTTYVFQVSDPIFGVDSGVVRVKQYGGEANGRKFYPKGVPRFEQGEEVVVMLYPLSNIGMTSTVGKEQGKFWIDDSSGTRIVRNKLNNMGLFRHLKHPAWVANPDWINKQPPVIQYSAFVETIRNLLPEVKPAPKRVRKR